MRLHLIQDGGPFKEEILVNRFPFVVGRHMGCDHQLHHPMVSRRHCRFDRHGNRVSVTDLASSNGTYLNGKPVRGTVALRNGDEVSLACLSFRVTVDATQEARV